MNFASTSTKESPSSRNAFMGECAWCFHLCIPYTRNSNDTCSDWKRSFFEVLQTKNRGQTGSRYTYMYIYMYKIHVYTFCLYITINNHIQTKATNCNVFQNLLKNPKLRPVATDFCLSTQLGKISSGTQILVALTGKIAFHNSNFQPREITKQTCISWNIYHINCCMTLLNQHYPQFKKHPWPTWRWTVRRDPDQPQPDKALLSKSFSEDANLGGTRAKGRSTQVGWSAKRSSTFNQKKGEISMKQWTQ